MGFKRVVIRSSVIPGREANPESDGSQDSGFRVVLRTPSLRIAPGMTDGGL